MVANATEHEVLGSIPGSDKVLLGFLSQDFFCSSHGMDLFPVIGNRLAPYYIERNKITGEMWFYY